MQDALKDIFGSMFEAMLKIDGTLIQHQEFLKMDLNRWGKITNINVIDINNLSSGELSKIISSADITICAWCYSERSIDILKALGLL